MCVHVQYSNKDAQGRITSVGGDGVGWLATPWRLSVQDTIKLHQTGDWVFFTSNPGGSERVLVGTTDGKVLRTYPDKTIANNLDWLPPGGRAQTGVKPGWPENPHTAKPIMVDVRRAGVVVPPLPRDGLYRTQPAAAVHVTFTAPWPALLIVTVNDEEAVHASSSLEEQRTLAEQDKGFYVTTAVTGLGGSMQTWEVDVVPPPGLRRSPVDITVAQRSANPACDPQPGDARSLVNALAAHSQTPRMRLSVGNQNRRGRLADLVAGERQALADYISMFLTDAVIDLHPHFDHDYTVVDAHRRYLTRLERFLATNGGKRFIPLPAWNPSEPIPAEFQKVEPYDDGTMDRSAGGSATAMLRSPLQNINPNIALPAGLQPPALCNLTTLRDLWLAMLQWHADVHFGVGGAMQDIHVSPSALIFWPWHAYVDNVYWDWEHC